MVLTIYYRIGSLIKGIAVQYDYLLKWIIFKWVKMMVHNKFWWYAKPLQTEKDWKKYLITITNNADIQEMVDNEVPLQNIYDEIQDNLIPEGDIDMNLPCTLYEKDMEIENYDAIVSFVSPTLRALAQEKYPEKPKLHQVIVDAGLDFLHYCLMGNDDNYDGIQIKSFQHVIENGLLPLYTAHESNNVSLLSNYNIENEQRIKNIYRIFITMLQKVVQKFPIKRHNSDYFTIIAYKFHTKNERVNSFYISYGTWVKNGQSKEEVYEFLHNTQDFYREADEFFLF